MHFGVIISPITGQSQPGRGLVPVPEPSEQRRWRDGMLLRTKCSGGPLPAAALSLAGGGIEEVRFFVAVAPQNDMYGAPRNDMGTADVILNEMQWRAAASSGPESSRGWN